MASALVSGAPPPEHDVDVIVMVVVVVVVAVTVVVGVHWGQEQGAAVHIFVELPFHQRELLVDDVCRDQCRCRVVPDQEGKNLVT